MKESEKRLMLLAFVILALIGGLIFGQRLLTWQRALDRDEDALAAESAEAKATLRERALWSARGDWLTKNQPKAKSDLEADNESFQGVVDKAVAMGLSVEQKQYQEPVRNEYYHQFGGTVTVKGDLPSVFRWIYSMQSPADFRVVPQMRIIPDKEDPTKVVCAIQFWHWYQSEVAQGS